MFYGYGVLNNHVPTLKATTMGGGVWDTDALAFISAASITDATQQSAVNTLVKDLKAASIWTKMKAIYPMVGGSATTHKWNLKDPRDLDDAFRLVFSGGWTHSANGALPNGTTAYADTKLTPQSQLTQNNCHLSFYSRSNTAAANRASMGSTNPSFTTSHQMFLRYTDDNFYGIIDSNSAFAQNSNTNTTGHYVVSRESNNSIKAYKNSSLISTNTTTITAIANYYSIFIGARSDAFTAQNFDDKETSFASIGDGLTGAEAANFYTAVQKYQTSLFRNI